MGAVYSRRVQLGWPHAPRQTDCQPCRARLPWNRGEAQIGRAKP